MPKPKPIEVAAPADLVHDEMKVRGWGVKELAQASGLSAEELLQPFWIDRRFAEGFAKAFGTSPQFWLSLQLNYDAWVDRYQLRAGIKP